MGHHVLLGLSTSATPPTLESHGVGCEHPPGWAAQALHKDTSAAWEPTRHDHFRANLVLTVMDNIQMSFRDWQGHTDHLLPLMLNDYHLIELERCEVAGRPGGRRLARHCAPNGDLVMLHQWFCTVDSVAVTLTATGHTDCWETLRPQMDAAARSLHLPDHVKRPEPLTP